MDPSGQESDIEEINFRKKEEIFQKFWNIKIGSIIKIFVDGKNSFAAVKRFTEIIRSNKNIKLNKLSSGELSSMLSDENLNNLSEVSSEEKEKVLSILREESLSKKFNLEEVVIGKAKIINELGLHARAAGVLAKALENFDASIYLIKGSSFADVESMLDVIGLLCFVHTQVYIVAFGKDAKEALRTTLKIIKNGFGEKW
jgi:phosphotransferase system HPr (HPr) family protein